MAQIARVTTWSAAQVLTASALNGEFNNIVNAWNNHDSGTSVWGQVKVTNASSVPVVLNATGSQNIANFQLSGSNVATIGNSGTITNGLSAVLGGVLFSTGSSVTVATSTTETSLIGTGGAGTKTLAANALAVGRVVKATLFGTYGTKASGPGNITFKFKFGSTVIQTLTGTSITANLSGCIWMMEYIFTTKAIGSGTSANGSTVGVFLRDTGGSADSAMADFAGVNATSSGFDSTSSQAIDVTVTWSVSDSANTITCNGTILEVMN